MFETETETSQVSNFETETLGYGLELHLWFVEKVQMSSGLMLPEYKNHQSNMVLQSYPKNLARIRYFLFVKKKGVESLARIS